jgi:hypothetical protein
MESSMEAPQKLRLELPYDSAIPLLCIYSKEWKSGDKYTYIPMFTAALFTISSYGNSPHALQLMSGLRNILLHTYIYIHVYHICVGTRHNETYWKLLNSTGWGERVRKSNRGGLTG